ncbi:MULTISPECIES: SRPBCC family protein [unclassified Mesorhizobium]|uniref:type II toxin-antitoxin system RatA family toxin n=1 Tax=unclassified Mesorhizobium TaxID=325217 RepID=UPI00333D3701
MFAQNSVADEPNRIAIVRLLRATPERTFEVVYDVEKFPEFMPNVLSARVLQGSEVRKLVEWEMTIDDAPLCWIEEIDFDHAQRSTRFRAVEGAFLRFDGSWTVTGCDAGTNLEVTVDYDLGVPEIEEFIAPILKVRLTENLEAMLDYIEARADLL